VQSFGEGFVMQYQKLAEITAKAAYFDFSAVNFDALHELFQQANFVS
jgi:hypothetical protein